MCRDRSAEPDSLAFFKSCSPYHACISCRPWALSKTSDVTALAYRRHSAGNLLWTTLCRPFAVNNPVQAICCEQPCAGKSMYNCTHTCRRDQIDIALRVWPSAWWLLVWVGCTGMTWVCIDTDDKTSPLKQLTGLKMCKDNQQNKILYIQSDIQTISMLFNQQSHTCTPNEYRLTIRCSEKILQSLYVLSSTIIKQPHSQQAAKRSINIYTH